jgi:hypothetical protein
MQEKKEAGVKMSKSFEYILKCLHPWLFPNAPLPKKAHGQRFGI